MTIPSGYTPQRYQEEKALGLRRPSGARPLTRLTGKHRRLILLHVNGLKAGEISQILNVSPAWVSTVLNDPLTQAEITTRFKELDGELFAKSISVVRNRMDQEDQDPALALRAADMVWRARGRYAEKPAERTSAEDIVQQMLAIAKDSGMASVTIQASAGGPVVEGAALPLAAE